MIRWKNRSSVKIQSYSRVFLRVCRTYVRTLEEKHLPHVSAGGMRLPEQIKYQEVEFYPRCAIPTGERDKRPLSKWPGISVNSLARDQKRIIVIPF